MLPLVVKHHRLHQKLQQHVLLLDAHGHPDADLLSAFSLPRRA
jgi:hypothetical protein